MFVLFISVLLAAMIYLSVFAIRNWSKYWKFLSYLPIIGMAFIVLSIVVDTPTSHNLWPIEILFWSVAGIGYMAILFFLRWLVDKLKDNR